MNFMQELRDAIAVTHQDIEALPYVQALAAGLLSRADYVRGLAQLRHIHDALESELARHPQLASVYRPDMARVPCLDRDLVVLAAPALPEPTPAAQWLIARIRAWSAELPLALLGALYVLEGSRMGSLVLARPLARSLGVPLKPGHGLDYHLDRASERPALWGQFKTALLQLPLLAGERADIVEAAATTMSAIYSLYEGLSSPAAVAEPEPIFSVLVP